MSMHGWIPVVLLTTALTASACARSDDGPPQDAAEADRAASSSDTAQAAGQLSAPNILAILDQVSVTDSTAAALAATKATSSELRAFARLMIQDHGQLRREVERVARRLRVTPELPVGDGSVATHGAALDILNTAERGRDFDKAYIDHEVAFHLDALETATSAMELARETEVQAFIQRMAPMLRDHLDRAQALQRRLR